MDKGRRHAPPSEEGTKASSSNGTARVAHYPSRMTLDANIVIAYLDGDQRVIQTLSSWKTQGYPLILPAVAESEILSFSDWTADERRKTELFLEEHFSSASFDRRIARIAADIRRDTKIKFPDSAIAATALSTHTPLVTRNVRDFKRIQNLSLITL